MLTLNSCPALPLSRALAALQALPRERPSRRASALHCIPLHPSAGYELSVNTPWQLCTAPLRSGHRNDRTRPCRPREPLNKSSGIALSRKWLRFGERLRRSYLIYEAKQDRAEDEPFLVPTLRALSWRAVCVVAPFAKGTTLGFTATPSIPSRQDSARPRGLVQRFPSWRKRS